MPRRLVYLLIALATMAARLPFLLRADRFFDADEAVEGLMARHLGDHSLLLWGQRYKGTPEVFLTGAVFHAAGSSVAALKAVTLACFVVFLCLNFRLVERMLSRRIAWMTTAFFIAAPPSLVFWTLSGSAEMVMTLLAGAVLLLAVANESWWIAGLALGFGLWVQQYILYYVVSLALVAATQVDLRTYAARVPRWLKAVLASIAAVAALYVLLGLAAFFTTGLDVRVAGAHITATHPQKMWWVAGALFATAAALAAAAIFRGQLVVPFIGFLIGYSPAIIGRLGNHGLGAPIARLDLAGLRDAMPDMTRLMLPILFGWREPLGRATVSPLLALVPAALVVSSYWTVWRRRLPAFFHVFPLAAAAMFLVSGSYIDIQSYRYLMPIYAAVPVIYALGVDGVWRASRTAASALLTVALLVFAAQQIDWYLMLTPDRVSAQTIACLDAAGVRAARAPYWRSYTVTFLTRERIIVSPVDGLDRYAPYSDMTRASPTIDQLGCR